MDFVFELELWRADHVVNVTCVFFMSNSAAGIVIAIGTARALTQVAAFFGGLGTYMYLGAGGMALVGTRYVTRRLVEFPPAAVAPGFVVGGNAITAKTAAKGPKWLTNRHRNLLTQMSHTLAPSTYKEEQAERELFWGDDDGTTFQSK